MANIDMLEFVTIVKNYFDADDINTIVEIGSLDGVDSVYFKECFPHAEVIAYEGLKENWENHKPSGVAWVNKVISSYDGETIYFVKITNGIHGIYDRGSIYGVETRIVPCYRLDSEFANSINKTIDMMKIDVEGATYDVFEGMGQLLNSVKIMHIETETVPYFAGQIKLHYEIYDFLKSRGFTCLKDAGARIQNGSQYDSVWINNDYLDS
jgi:FkbM family methyltransferase